MAIEAFLATKAQKAFLFTVCLQAVILLTMVGIVYGNINDNFAEPPKTIPCYLALFALAEIFEVLITIDALRLRNTIQLIGILLFHMAMIVMSGLQIYQTREVLETTLGPCTAETYATCSGPGSLFNVILKFLVIVPSVLFVSLLVLIYVTRELFHEFGWAVFHAIGADPRMKRMYQYYQIMVCLLKFDFFCFTGVTMQLLILVLTGKRAEFIVTIVAIPVVLLLLMLCGFSLSREWVVPMIISLILMVCAESYFIYKLIRVYQPVTTGQYLGVKGSLTTFLIVAALLLAMTFGVGVRCFADFHRGLKDSKISDPEKQRTKNKAAAGNGYDAPGMGQQGSLGRRISIE